MGDILPASPDLASVPKFLKPFAYVWASTTSIVALIVWFLPLLITKQMKPIRWLDGAWEWGVVPNSWFDNNYSGTWAATTLGFIIFLAPNYVNDPNTHVHERRHVWQSFILGPTFIPIYLLGYIPALFKGSTDVPGGYSPGYWWNFFEQDARNAAKNF